jgi:hypothetical protein
MEDFEQDEIRKTVDTMTDTIAEFINEQKKTIGIRDNILGDLLGKIVEKVEIPEPLKLAVVTVLQVRVAHFCSCRAAGHDPDGEDDDNL